MKGNPEENVRLQQAFLSAADGAGVRPDCPEPERIWDGVAGQLGVEQAREVVNHTASCPSCAEAWRLACTLTPSAHEEHPKVVRPTLAARGGWRWTVATAAVVVLGVVGVHLLRTGQVGRPAAGTRDSASETIRSLLVDGEAMPRQRFLLRWVAETGPVRHFEVRVASEDLEVIATGSELTESEYLVPEDALAHVSAGERILWQVEALLEDGSKVASPTFVNRLE